MSETAPLSWRQWLCGAALLVLPFLTCAQTDDPPARVASISALDGPAQVAVGGNWTPATLNWPVATGMRLDIADGARTELQAGASVIRLSGKADLAVTVLDDDTLQMALTEGTLSLRVRDLDPGERVEIDTPQLALVASQPGEYRLDVDSRRDTTRLTVFAGAATVYGEDGRGLPITDRQQTVFGGRNLMVVTRGSAPARDRFDQWAASRDAQQDASASLRYAGRDVPGAALLDQYGQWAQDATYGPVWYPSVSAADWAPYRHGDWQWVEPWGWTWVDQAPWGFAPTHYGRWMQIGPSWAWVPGPVARRPVYAPALVGFVGATSGDATWGVTLGGGLPGTAWFPLAPGEYWEPHYRTSDRYRRRLNEWHGGREARRPPPDGYHFERRPGAVTSAPHERFGSRPGDRDVRRTRDPDGRALPPSAVDRPRVVPPPPRAYLPGQSTELPAPRSPTVVPPPQDERRFRDGGNRQGRDDDRRRWQQRDDQRRTPQDMHRPSPRIALPRADEPRERLAPQPRMALPQHSEMPQVRPRAAEPRMPAPHRAERGQMDSTRVQPPRAPEPRRERGGGEELNRWRQNNY